MNNSKVDDEKLLEYYKEGLTYVQIAAKFNCSTRLISEHLSKLRAKNELNLSEDERISTLTEKQQKKIQRLQDVTTSERRTWRNDVRYENAIEAYTDALIEEMKKYQISSKVKTTPKVKNQKKTGIVHLSDLHLNELINLECNKYDFRVASQRLQKFATKLKVIFKAMGVNSVVIAMTGDTLNSDRRLDELLNMATNRAKATILSVQLLELFILDLAKDFHITLGAVVGNESRAKKDFEWTELTATDNYDFMIYHMLKLLFKKVKNVVFESGNSVEHVMEISGQNVLLIHGNQLKNTANLSFELQKIRSKYVSNYKRSLSFILFGHIHECFISDTFARSSSLSGGNAYSDHALKLESRASQNAHVIYANGDRDSFKIDLQDVKDYPGYDFEELLDVYNAKSITKARKKATYTKLV